MFNIGGGELLVIALIALIVLGPQRLPGAARQAGKVLGDLRRVSTGFQDELRSAINEADAGDRTPTRRSPLAQEPELASPSAEVAGTGEQAGAGEQDDAVAAAVPPTATAPGPLPERQPARRATATTQPAPSTSTAKQATARKATPGKATAKKATAKRATAKKATAKKATAKRATGKATAKRATKKATAKKATAKKAAPRRRSST